MWDFLFFFAALFFLKSVYSKCSDPSSPGGRNEASGTNIAFQHPEGFFAMKKTKRKKEKKQRDDDGRGDFFCGPRPCDPAVTHALCHLGFHRGGSGFAVA